MQIGTSGLWGKGMKDQLLVSGDPRWRSHSAKVGEIYQEQCMEFQAHMAGTHYSKCPLCDNNWDAEGQRSRSHEVKTTFWGLAPHGLGWIYLFTQVNYWKLNNFLKIFLFREFF